MHLHSRLVHQCVPICSSRRERGRRCVKQLFVSTSSRHSVNFRAKLAIGRGKQCLTSVILVAIK